MALYINANGERKHFDIIPDKHTDADGVVWVMASTVADGVKPKSSLSEQIGGSHYKNMPIQPVAFIQQNKIPYIEGCCIKYLCRWREKNGIEDLKKARHYLDILIEMEEKKC